LSGQLVLESAWNFTAQSRTLRAKGLIEIVLPGGTSVRVDAHVDDRALRCVLDALHAR